MNDRFKFRVWDKNNKVYFGGSYGVSYYMTDSEIDGDLYCRQCDGPFELSKDNDFIVEQCTGLKDKNGELIYEGDVVDLDDSETYAVIQWGEEDGCWRIITCENSIYTFDNLYGYELTICGNIHENADLLGEDK
jgi:uncharacterized phage protein (TIGR01671 family)